MVQLLGRNKDGQFQILDTQSDLTISLTRSVEEIEDINQRKGAYSKTFEIPGTSNNDRFFRSVFDVNATDFNSTLQTDCIIQQDGNDLFRGILRLNKIFVSNSGNFYEVYVLEDVGSLSTELQDIDICELDFTDIIHDVNYNNIVSTWNYSGGSYTNYSGIIGRILYPIANTGFDLAFSQAIFQPDSQGISGVLQINQFKPWINLKYLLDKIFEKTSFTYSSSFFNTDYFYSQFMLMGTSDTTGVKSLENNPENQNFFSVSYGASNYYFYDQPSQADVQRYNYLVYDLENFDYLNTYTPSTIPGSVVNYFTAPISGQYRFAFRQKVINGGIFVPTFIDVVLRDIDTNTNLFTLNDVQIPNSEVITMFANILVTLTQGQRVSMMFQRQLLGEPYNPLYFFREDSLFELVESPGLTAPNLTIHIPSNLECMSGLDLFKNLVKLYNLTVLPEGEKNFRIEPYNNYLSQSGTTTYDWTEKLNLNTTYTIEPLDYSLSKKINLTYQPGGDINSQRFLEQEEKVFGTTTYSRQNNLLSGELDVDVTFESLPTILVGTTGSTCIIPSLYDETEDSLYTTFQKPISSKSRIGFYCGLAPYYLDNTTTLGTYFIQSGVTNVGHQYYPAVNHLSRLTEDDDIPFSDLNFQTDYDFFSPNALSYLSNPLAVSNIKLSTDKTIYKQFYKQYLDLLYSDEVRIFTGEFILTPEDVVNINFNDSVVFLNSVWRLYEIQDADITQESAVTCKFLKLPFRPSPITLTAPNYTGQTVTRTISPTPTPTPNFCYSHNVRYGSFTDVCEGTAPIMTYYSKCTNIEGGCIVYLDSNCSSVVPQNTYFYPVSSPDLDYIHFVVNQGTVFNVVCL